ncbi:hypothetical protein KSU1_B0034 [Candidatus Jettenia caeni]|uniref:Uncharacterized protein n=1 Tax=Candidatus Jettenia caeni TaxID=247490 RepID=I3IGP6_9BACT|nr:hypothetical protein KSU1_B0034 [Candidatus Jettenia caeni]
MNFIYINKPLSTLFYIPGRKESGGKYATNKMFNSYYIFSLLYLQINYISLISCKSSVYLMLYIFQYR